MAHFHASGRSISMHIYCLSSEMAFFFLQASGEVDCGRQSDEVVRLTVFHESVSGASAAICVTAFVVVVE